MRGEEEESLIETITDLILNARGELLAARSVGDLKSERVWAEALDRLLESYIEDKQLDADD